MNEEKRKSEWVEEAERVIKQYSKGEVSKYPELTKKEELDLLKIQIEELRLENNKRKRKPNGLERVTKRLK